MSDQANHPAFPCEAQPDRDVPPEHDYIQTGSYSGKFPGITMRDWFAGQALAAIIGSSPAEAVQDVCSGVRAGRPMAYGAYAIADAMLAERAKARGEA